MFGMIVGMVGAAAAITGSIWPFFGLTTTNVLLTNVGINRGILWWGYLYIGLAGFSLAFMVWGLMTWIWADEYTNEARVFRAWRTNFLAHAFHLIVELNIFAWWMFAQLMAGSLTDLIGFAFFIGAFVFAGIGFGLIFFMKGWWWNIDTMGMMRCDEHWSLFGIDTDWERWWTPEEVEDDMDGMDGMDDMVDDEF